MPFKPPPRDMSTVKCIKRSKDKNGEEQIEYMVQFDYEAPQWDLTEENVMDLKEIFIMFDTDVDGVISIDQVYQAMNVMGMRRSDEEILAQVKNVSADSKNNTLEFNEFIKMVALDMKTDATKNRDELFEAFREFDKDEDGKLSEAELREIMVSLGEEPVTEQEFKHFIKCFPVDAEGLLEYEGFCKTVCGKKKVK